MKYWIVLIGSAFFEAVWAVALDKSEGFTRLVPVLVFFAGMAVSMGGLGYALKGVPVGTGYAIWVAIGAATTIIYSMATGLESFSIVKALLLLGLVACVVGLKVVSD